MDDREKAKKIYMDARMRGDQITFQQLVDRSKSLFGRSYSMRTLKKWAAEDGWTSTPYTVNTDSPDIRRSMRLLDDLFERCITSKSSSELCNYSRAFRSIAVRLPKSVLLPYYSYIEEIRNEIYEAVLGDVTPRLQAALVTVWVDLKILTEDGAIETESGFDVDEMLLFGEIDSESIFDETEIDTELH